MTILTLAVGIILGAGWLWLWQERRTWLSRMAASDAYHVTHHEAFDRLNEGLADFSDRLAAVENPVQRMASQREERAKIATRLRVDPKYSKMSDDQLQIAVDQIVAAQFKRQGRTG